MNKQTTGLDQERTAGLSPDEIRGTGASPSQPETTSAQSMGGASGTGSALRDSARQAKEQLKQNAVAAKEELKHQGAEALHQIQEQGQTFIAQQRDQILEKIQHCSLASRRAADQLRQENDPNLANLAEGFANQLERASSYLRGGSLRGMCNDVERFARRQPEIFFGGMFLAGLGLARFLKASRQPEETEFASGESYAESDDWEVGETGYTTDSGFPQTSSSPAVGSQPGSSSYTPSTQGSLGTSTTGPLP
jgi:hypothetical protein